MTTTAFAPRFDLSNVFMPARAAIAEETVAGSSEACFAFVKNGPPVPADEVESHVDAVEVTVRWGSQVLSVSHLESGKSFFVGDGADLALPEDVLGATRAPIVVARGAGAYVVVPRGARGSVATRGGESETFAAMAARGALPASGELDGACEIALAHGMNVVLEIGATRADGTSGEPVTFEIGTVRAGKVAPVGFLAALAGGATGFVGLSFLGHAAIVASLALFMPKMSPDDSDAMDRDQVMLMQKYLSASAEREAEQPKETGPSDSTSGGGSTGEMHKDEAGAAGTTKPVTSTGRMAIKGNETNAALSPKAELALARDFGMIGIALSSSPADPNAPASKWATTPVGNEVISAQGDMFSPSIGDAMGFGLGLSGNGEGGGGNGLGVGFDHVNTVGGGGGGTGKFGLGPGDKGGMGIGHGQGNGVHVVKMAPIRTPDMTTNGRLPADVIQRIVRQNFGRFRLCYEAGLRGNPSLSGRVATKFVIGRDGAVNQSSDAGSDLPDQNVVACVVRSFNALSFPSPEGGIATVTYPIILTPGE
ncbi:MAG TPA: AgmX/PglI C-terminal domain-containing protein [Labilithrix sp.]|nr:AgmX/PglI C-terminal domain-containing protein [Labilithrix sp.]